jgi:hypothetical protein
MDTGPSSGARLFAEWLSKHSGGQVAKARMTPLAIVNDFDDCPD